MFIPLDGDDLEKLYFLIFPQNYSRDKFIEKARVNKSSYACTVIEEILDIFESTSKNVVCEYQKYYNMEYSDVYEYIYKHYNIQREIIDILKEHYTPLKKLYYGSATASGDYNTADLLFQEKMYDAINIIFEEINNEDQN